MFSKLLLFVMRHISANVISQNYSFSILIFSRFSKMPFFSKSEFDLRSNRDFEKKLRSQFRDFRKRKFRKTRLAICSKNEL